MDGNEESVAAALTRNPPQRAYIVSSFLPRVLLSLNDIDARIPLGYICEHAALMEGWREMPIEIFVPRQDMVSPQLVEEVHGHGKQMMTWTVNSARRMQQLAKWGVDGLISDDPQLLSRTFGGGLTRE